MSARLQNKEIPEELQNREFLKKRLDIGSRDFARILRISWDTIPLKASTIKFPSFEIPWNPWNRENLYVENSLDLEHQEIFEIYPTSQLRIST